MGELTVYDLMTLHPVTVTPETSLRVVLTRMRQDGCRQLPVLNELGQLVGIITDRDLRLAMNSPFVLHERWQDETLLDTMTADSCMTPDPIYVTPDAPAHQAARLLSSHKFGALPVVREGVLVGIISVTDFLDLFIEQEERLMVVDN